MNRISATVAPPSKLTASQYSSNLMPSQPASSATNTLDRSLGVYLWVHPISASKWISKLARSRAPTASLSSLNLGLQWHLQTHLITASKCISDVNQCRSPIASPNLLDHGLQVDHSGTTVGVQRYRGSGVDGHRLICISSCHSTKIHTQSFPTFGLTHSVRDFVAPDGWVISYVLTFFLRSWS